MEVFSNPQMNIFLLNKTQFYIDRPDEYAALYKYITGDQTDPMLIKWVALIEATRLILDYYFMYSEVYRKYDILIVTVRAAFLR